MVWQYKGLWPYGISDSTDDVSGSGRDHWTFSSTQRRVNPAGRFFYYGFSDNGCFDRIGTFIRISAGK